MLINIRFHSRYTLRTSAACLIALGLNHAWGDSPASVQPQQTAYQTSIAQEELKKQTELVQTEIQRLIKNLQENGMGADSVTHLQVISTNLSRLSQGDMQKVILILENASIESRQQSREQEIADAFSNQKNVSDQLKNLATQLSAQQEGDKLPAELEALIIRQSANVRLTSVLSGISPDKLSDSLKTTHQIASSEQNSIGTEVASLVGSLSNQTSQDANQPAVKMAEATYAYASHSMILDTTSAASTLTKDGPYADGVAKQKSVHDYLSGMLQAALSALPPLDQLNRAKSQLDQLVSDQKNLNQATKDAKIDPATLAQRQNDLNDQVGLAKDSLKSLNPEAAAKLDEARSKMDLVAGELPASTDSAKTEKDEEELAKTLDDADKQLAQQVASAEAKQNESPEERQADLQKLKDAIDQDKQLAKIDPQAAAKDLQHLQQDAMPEDPDAAKDLADATDKLTQPPPDKDDAEKDMDAAKAALQNQQDAIAQDAQDYKALRDTNQALEQAKQDTQAADNALQGDPAKSLTDAARQLSQAQNAANQVAQSKSGQMPPGAQQAAQQASDALKDSLNQAVQANRASAHQRAQSALQQLQNAQNTLAQSMSSLQQKFSQKMQGQSMSSSGQLPNASQTPTDTNQAMAGGAGQGGGSALVMGALSTKDRDALTQFQTQKTPPEYATQVEQYMKNLAGFESKN